MEKTLSKIIEILKKLEIRPVVYGSLGCSCYLGDFKEFADIDLLIDDQFIDGDWEDFKLFLSQYGFILINEREHEFLFNNISVGFAKKSILIRDCIIKDYADFVKYKEFDADTLLPEHFLVAYRFSVKDGYRLMKRHKKDQKVIDKLFGYIELNNIFYV